MINLNILNKSMLGIFFLYLILISRNLYKTLNCKIQDLLMNNIYISHIIIFISIVMFTFILNWYTPTSLVIKESFDLDNYKNQYNNRYKYIKDSLKYSVFIYIIFILSTKQDYIFIYSFLILFILMIGIYILYNIEINALNLENINISHDFLIDNSKLKTLFINTNELKNNDIDKTIFNMAALFHNSLSIGYILICINLFIGVYLYYKRQSKEHKNWSWLKFIFGTNSCKFK